MQTLKKVKSLCPDCYRAISGRIIEKNNQIILEKTCRKHGKFSEITEIDPEFYKSILNVKPYTQKLDSTKFTIPIIKKCNLECEFCYFYNKKESDPSLQKIKKLIDNYQGLYISVTGGEPTLSKNVFKIIRHIKYNSKISNLSTNGIELANEKLVRRLKKSGLNKIHFSLNALNDNILKKMHGKRILTQKIAALNNIRKYNIDTSISFLIQKNVNNKELGKIYRLCLDNPFIKELRIRATSPSGKYQTNDAYYMSELVGFACQLTKIRKKDIISKLKDIKRDKKLCNINLDVIVYFEKGKYHTLGWKIMTFKKKKPLESRILSFSNNIIFRKMLKYINILRFINTEKSAANFIIRFLRHRDKIKSLRIGLRSWPNKFNLDLDEIKLCPSITLTYDEKILPFCVSHIYNEAKKRGIEKNLPLTGLNNK